MFQLSWKDSGAIAAIELHRPPGCKRLMNVSNVSGVSVDKGGDTLM
ncbi:MAG: hypothetical protein HY525_15100 [Betaproteobacteria bacterium]|nr:hypothetical protein [Betaproteobacteria bacterium]